MSKVLADNIKNAVGTHGESILQAVHIKTSRMVKKEILTLVGTYVNLAEDPHFVAANFVPPLLGPVLGDFAGGVPGAREPEVGAPFLPLFPHPFSARKKKMKAASHNP